MTITPLATSAAAAASLPALSRTEAKVLTLAAAEPAGRLILPPHLKPATVQRLIAKFLKHALVVAIETDAAVGHTLTPSGYRAVGLEPPIVEAIAATAKLATKRDLVLGLLRRTGGATLAELIAATGWLPHTTRAALSRLRSAGQPLVKATREDGATAYRIQAEEPAPRRRSSATPARRRSAESQTVTA